MQIDLTNKTKEELLQLAEVTTALKQKYRHRLIDFLMPATGKYSRDKYHKAMAFFAAGVDHRFRMYGGSNGSGKSFTGAMELTYHITGDYPEWWPGRRLENPKHVWIVSESGGTFKSSLQRVLLGETVNDEDLGTGLIPKERLGKTSGWPSLSGAVSAFEVKHKKGHWVTVEVKSSDQKRENLQAANLDILFEDEEPPLDVHTECLFRLRGSPKKPPGILMLMYTPIKGVTDLTLQFLDDGQFPNGGKGGTCKKDPDKYAICIDMSEVPHLSDDDKRAYENNCPPHEREARIHGRPGMGSGKIYPIPEEKVFVPRFNIPDFWPRCFTLDFGWHCTAAIWAAKDPQQNIIYVYGEYYQGEQSVQIHALNVKARGPWIPGICDPSLGGRDGSGKLIADLYRAQGLDLTAGNNDIAGIQRNLEMFQNGSLKMFDDLENSKNEYRMYRYDSKDPNVPAKNQKDHIMDCIKYLTSRFDWVAKTQEELERRDDDSDYQTKRHSSRDKSTGY